MEGQRAAVQQKANVFPTRERLHSLSEEWEEEVVEEEEKEEKKEEKKEE